MAWGMARCVEHSHIQAAHGDFVSVVQRSCWKTGFRRIDTALIFQ